MRARYFYMALFYAALAGVGAESHRYGVALFSALLGLSTALDGVADRLRERTP